MKFISFPTMINCTKVVFARFPFLMLLFILQFVLGLISVHQKFNPSPVLVNIMATNLLLILLTGAVYTAKIGRNWGNKSLIAFLIVFAIAIGYYLILPEKWEYPWYERHFLLSLTATILLLITAFDFKKEENENLVNFYLLTISRVAVTVLFATVIYIGIASAFWSIEALFGLKISENFYFDLLVFISCIFSPIYFLAGIPTNFQETEFILTKPFKILLQYLLLPLVVLYLLILYIYMGKIAFTLTWPEGVVAELILTYSSIGIVTFFALYTLSKKEQWIKLFSNYFYIALLPLVLMLMLAIKLRIEEYGFTTERFFVVIFATWLSLVSAYISFSKNKNLKFLPILLFILTLFTAIGPFNAFVISENSQLARANKILLENGFVVNGKLKPKQGSLDFKTNKTICSTLDYLERSKVLAKLPFVATLPKNEQNTQAILTKIDLRYIGSWDNEQIPAIGGVKTFNISGQNEDFIVKISGYDFLIDFNSYRVAGIKLDSTNFLIKPKVDGEKTAIIVEKDTVEFARFELNKEIEAMLKNKGNFNGYTYQLKTQESMIKFQKGDLELLFILNNGYIKTDKEEKKVIGIDNIYGKLLVKLPQK